MKDKIAPSMMCCDFLNMGAQLRAFENKDIELLHIDIMDGNFVPNFALGTDFTKQLKKATEISRASYRFVSDRRRGLRKYSL